MNNNLRESRPRLRAQFVEAVGVNAFIAGVALAGRLMIWMEMFSPGITPNREIIGYWPVFLTGGVLLGLPAAIAARIIYNSCFERDQRYESKESRSGSGTSDNVIADCDLHGGQCTSLGRATHSIRLSRNPTANLKWTIPGSSCSE